MQDSTHDPRERKRYRQLHRGIINRQKRESYARHRGEKIAARRLERVNAIKRSRTEAREKRGGPPRTLVEWFYTQDRYLTWAEFATAIGVGSLTVRHWRNGTKEPERKHRRKLFELAGLERYTGFECVAGKVPDDLPETFGNLLRQADKYLIPIIHSRATHGLLFRFFIHCFQNLVRNGVLNPQAVKPEFLLRHRPDFMLGKNGPRMQRWALGHIGKIFAETGHWTAEDLKAWATLLRDNFPRAGGPKRRPEPRTIPLIAELVYRCGFLITELRSLKVPHVEAGGLRFDEKRFIPFGDGWHQVSRVSFESWMSEAKPTAFLFFQCQPWNKAKPTRELWLRLHCGHMKNGQSFRNYRTRHFEEDFRQDPHPRRFRLHLQDVHGMRQFSARLVVRQLQQRIGVFLPVPYLIGIMAVSRLCDCSPRQIQSGRAAAFTWPDLNGYEITVRWPNSFLEQVRDMRVRPGIARELLRLALAAWKDQYKIDKRGWGRFDGLDRHLAEKLELIHVFIRCLKTGRSWRGNLLRRRESFKCESTRTGQTWRRANSRGFDLPLLEDLQGGSVHGRCKICRHPERSAIDEAIRGNSTMFSIATRYGFQRKSRGYRDLLWHAGRFKHSLPGHVGSGPPAVLVKIPGKFMARIARENATNLGREIASLYSSPTAAESNSVNQSGQLKPHSLR